MRAHDLKVDRDIGDANLPYIKKLGYDIIAYDVEIPLDQISTAVPPKLPAPSFSTPRVLSRVTVLVDELGKVRPRDIRPALRAWDIVAVRPANATALRLAIDQIPCDIISLPMGDAQLGYKIKKEHLNLALQDGVQFEVCVRDILMSPKSRQNVIKNISRLSFATRGKSLLISSDAKNKHDLRRAADIGLIAKYVRMDWRDKYSDPSIYHVRAGAAALAHSEARRSFKGAVAMVKVLEPEAIAADTPATEEPAPETAPEATGDDDAIRSCHEDEPGKRARIV